GSSDVCSSDLPVNFGNVTVGGTLQHTLTISNTGNQTLTLGSATLPTGFTFVQAPPGSLTAGASADVIIGVDTNVATVRSGTLMIPSNDPDTAVFDVPLIAQVGVPDIDISLNGTLLTSGQAAPVDFGTVAVGATAQVTLAGTNSGMG